jgi:hypothetical protein
MNENFDDLVQRTARFLVKEKEDAKKAPPPTPPQNKPHPNSEDEEDIEDDNNERQKRREFALIQLCSSITTQWPTISAPARAHSELMQRAEQRRRQRAKLMQQFVAPYESRE